MKNLIVRTLGYACLTLLLLILCYHYIDRSLVLYIHGHVDDNSILFCIATVISRIFDPDNWTVVLIIALVISLINFLRSHHRCSKIYTLSISLLIASIVTTIFKIGLARYRPELYLQHDLYGFHLLSTRRIFNSFPSGHVALSFAGLLAIATFFNKKWLTLLFIVMCLIIAACRIIVTQHYLSDTIGAAYIGIFSYLWAKAIVDSRVIR
ncbi:MAG: phosphatase PAP2 family protein [Francisellaceae bacterium]